MPRIIKNPGVFAADAQTTIPPTPVVGVAYRNAATGLAAIRAGWPFKTIVDSSDFAQILHELTSLTDLIDKTGILEYKDDIDYDLVPAFAVGSDGELYKSTAINGPATTVVDPVGDLTGVWVGLISNAQEAVSGVGTFANATNSIELVGFGAIEGLEVGDVYAVTGTASNNTEFTVEAITDDDNVIVNQAHAGGTTTKSLVDETVSCTVTLLSKWYNAPKGLGQGWVDVKTSRALNVEYTNSTGRTIEAIVTATGTFNGSILMDVGGVILARTKGGDYTEPTVSTAGYNDSTVTVPGGATYEGTTTGTVSIDYWSELR